MLRAPLIHPRRDVPSLIVFNGTECGNTLRNRAGGFVAPQPLGSKTSYGWGNDKLLFIDWAASIAHWMVHHMTIFSEHIQALKYTTWALIRSNVV